MEYDTIKLGIIGAGKWGINHIRTAAQLIDPKSITACDLNPSAKERISSISDEIGFTSDQSDILNNNEINSVIIVTPAETHFEIAKKAIESRKHVLVEKPITLYSYQAEQLVQLAKSYNVRLMVGHILLYHPAINKIKEGIQNGMIGNLQYIYSNRLNLGTLRSEENILWSFAPHDISVIQYLTENYPNEVHCHGADFLQNNVEDTTLTYLKYPGNIHAHIYVSWLHPFKEQRLVVVGSKGMFVFEDTRREDKLRFFSKGFKNVNGSFQKIDNEAEIIEIGEAMPLILEQKHFYDSIINGTDPLTNGVHALEVLKILETAEEELFKVRNGKSFSAVEETLINNSKN